MLTFYAIITLGVAIFSVNLLVQYILYCTAGKHCGYTSFRKWYNATLEERQRTVIYNRFKL